MIPSLRAVSLVAVLVSAACSASGRNLTPGKVTLADVAGDMTSGLPVDTEPPGPDLRSVSVRIGEEYLVVTFVSHEPLSALRSDRARVGPSWYLQIWVPADEGPAREYLLSVATPTLMGTSEQEPYIVLLCPRHLNCKERVPDAKVIADGSTLVVVVRLDRLPELRVPFEWSASSSWSARPTEGVEFRDRLPDAIKGEEGPRAAFPKASD